jgi:hypothetical protein
MQKAPRTKWLRGFCDDNLEECGRNNVAIDASDALFGGKSLKIGKKK